MTDAEARIIIFADLVKDYMRLVDKYAVLKKGLTIKQLVEMAHANDRLEEAIEQIRESEVSSD